MSVYSSSIFAFTEINSRISLAANTKIINLSFDLVCDINRSTSLPPLTRLAASHLFYKLLSLFFIDNMFSPIRLRPYLLHQITFEIFSVFIWFHCWMTLHIPKKLMQAKEEQWQRRFHSVIFVLNRICADIKVWSAKNAKVKRLNDREIFEVVFNYWIITFAYLTAIDDLSTA